MKYQQIVEKIVNQIKCGEFKRGDRLPSIRSMVSKTGFNKATIIKAYDILEEKHIIYAIPKSGYYIIGLSDETKKNDSSIDFSRISPTGLNMPYRAFNHCSEKAIQDFHSELFGYDMPQGFYAFRSTLSSYLNNKQIYCKPEQLCITNGAQQALYILSHMQFPNSKEKILIESTTYTEMIHMLQLNHLPYLTVKRDCNGLNLKGIEASFKEGNVKCFYTMSRFHNPLGTHLSVDEKKRLLELAEKYDVYILEDDYFAEFDYKDKYLPLHYYDTHNRVIHIRSFSKSFMPGIRLGCVILPNHLIDKFIQYKRLLDLGTSPYIQGLFNTSIESGIYSKHIKQVNQIYERHHEVFMNQLKHHDFDMSAFAHAEGYFYWLNLPPTINSTSFTKRLREKGVLVVDGNTFSASHEDSLNGIRLSIMSLTEEKIRHGASILAQTYNEFS